MAVLMRVFRFLRFSELPPEGRGLCARVCMWYNIHPVLFNRTFCEDGHLLYRTVQCSNYWPHVASEHLTYGWCEKRIIFKLN